MSNTKLKINSSTSPTKTPGGMEVTIRPETFKHNKAVDIKTKNVGNTGAQATQFVGMGPETLDFVADIEHTGAITGSSDVQGIIDGIMGHCASYDGGVHRTKYVTITYGKIVFLGQLESANVDYKRFDSQANPMRAEVSLKFKSVNEVGASSGSAGNQSPDMTHGRTVRDGDSLTLLCKEVYGKMDYYLAVAEHNGLTNFRELEVGSVIEFPPLER